MEKKSKERNILSLVYDVEAYEEFIESEQPDFLLRHSSMKTCFGVEITEFYYSESNARLRNIPEYFTELIEKDNYRHKDDKRELRVDDITLLSSENEVKAQIRGILQRMPTVDEYVEMITDVIKLKGQKYTQYNSTLSHVNLILFDAERRLHLLPTEQFYRQFCTRSLVDALYVSPFREVFFVTLLNESRHVYIPLKAVLLVSEYYLFSRIMTDYPWETSGVFSSTPGSLAYLSAEHKFMVFFSNYLRAKTNDICIRVEDTLAEVILAGWGIALDTNRDDLLMRDYSDHQLPSDVTVIFPNPLMRFLSSLEFRNTCSQILADYVFETNLAFDVKSVPDF